MSSLPFGRRWTLCAVGLLLLAVPAPGAQAATVAWSKTGAFEVCLEVALEAWIAAQAELEVNEDAAAGRLDDAAVADWTLATIAQCSAKGPAAEADSEARFTRHMAHWRRHVYERAADIRKKGHSD